MVALAFAAWLKEADFDFLLALSADTPKPEIPLCDLDRIDLPAVNTRAADWQKALYFLVHLVPVDDIGRLLHQMRKWELLAKDSEPAGGIAMERIRQIQAALELYLYMHDAKFEGGAALAGIGEFKALFDSDDAFARIFPLQPGADDDRRVPRRGLREIVRFGHLPALLPVFGKHRIATAEVDEYLRLEHPQEDGKSEIARLQAHREALHEEWTEKKKDFAGDRLRTYVETLAAVVRHRHLAAHVTLTDHVRLHRLLMAVLGRLVDYSGLWERDLYFVTLALVHEAGCRPGEVFTDKGRKRLGQGRIVDALRDFQQTPDAGRIKDGLRRYFSAVWEKGNCSVRRRNNFAHFDMLKPANLPVDLTACVNDSRDLMAYDRKLRNAVSQSVRELLHREGLDFEWTMDPAAPHRLGAATMESRGAPHLGGMRVPEKRVPQGRGRARRRQILENLHGDRFIAMAAALFGRCSPQRPESVVDWRPDAMDWSPPRGKNRNPGGKNRRGNGHGGGRKHGNAGRKPGRPV